MLSNSNKKFVNSLKQKKFRQEHKLFVVEGVKMVEELLKSNFEVSSIYGNTNWINQNKDIDANEVSEKELASISSLKTPNEVLALVKQPDFDEVDYSNELSIALDKVQDPGNLGSIVRTADWFGINHIVCSEDCVELYNPKVIQASMGSLFRVKVVYKDLINFFSKNKELTIYGALLEGNNIYKEELKSKGSILLMGNESKGVSEQFTPFISDKISIPKFGEAESLNVALATAVICSEFRRD